MFQSPTLESLAQRISDQNWKPRWTSLVPLQLRGDKRPLFCLHGWGGAVFGFIHLAEKLGPDRPVYGLQAYSLEAGSHRHTTVEQMARHYVTEMRSVQPRGPYYLAGHSLGGWIAYAVAQELHTQGETVALLALLDTQNSANVGWHLKISMMAPLLLTRIPRHLRLVLTLSRQEGWQYLKHKFQWLRMRLPGPELAIPQTLSDSDSSQYQEASRVIDYFAIVVSRYRPYPYAGNVVVFAGEDQKAFEHTKFWKNFVRGKVDFYRVSGDHYSLISKDNVDKFAVLFRRLLAEADEL